MQIQGLQLLANTDSYVIRWSWIDKIILSLQSEPQRDIAAEHLVTSCTHACGQHNPVSNPHSLSQVPPAALICCGLGASKFAPHRLCLIWWTYDYRAENETLRSVRPTSSRHMTYSQGTWSLSRLNWPGRQRISERRKLPRLAIIGITLRP